MMNVLLQTTILWLSVTIGLCHDEVYTLNGFLGWLEQFESSYVGPNTAYRSRASLREVSHGVRSLVPQFDDIKHKYLLFGVYGLVTNPDHLIGADKSAVPSNLYNTESVTRIPTNIREKLKEIMEFKIEKAGGTYTAEGIILIKYPDGTSDTVAPGYLIMGICAGLEYNRASNFNLESINNLVATTIGELLVASSLRSRNGTQGTYVGPAGQWDDPNLPHKFTFDSKPTAATDAQVKGAIDGFLIGKKLSQLSKSGRDGYSLPEIIQEYYSEEAKYRFYFFYQNMERIDLEDEVYRCARICSREEACGTNGVYDIRIVDCQQDDAKLRRATETAVDKFYNRYLAWSAPLEIAKG